MAYKKTSYNIKAVRMINGKAVRLVVQRALREGRSAANACAQTIIEALGQRQNTRQRRSRQP